MSALSKPAGWIFTVICFILCGYMVENQIEKYFRNEDTSTISFKKFSNERYPTYTFCFEDNHDDAGMYKAIASLRSNLILDDNSVPKVYFDGKYLRLERSDVGWKDWKTMNTWKPNNTVQNIEGLIGQSGSMYGPITTFEGLAQHLILFNETFFIPRDLYKRILKGSNDTNFKATFMNGGPNWSKSVINITYSPETVAHIDFADSTINMMDFLEEYHANTDSGLTVGWVDEIYEKLQTYCSHGSMNSFFCHEQYALKSMFESRTKITFPFGVSYQDPSRICYTPTLNDSISTVHDYVTLDLETMSEQLTANYNRGTRLPYLRVYIHMKGQFIRTLGRDVVNYATADLMNEHCTNKELLGIQRGKSPCYSSKVSFLMTQATLLKKRHDAIAACDKNLKNEDTQILKSIMEKVGCAPSYWKEISPDYLTYPKCNLAGQYKAIYGYVTNVSESRSLFTPPCEEMLVVTNIRKEQGRKREQKSMDRSDLKGRWVSYLDFEFVQGSEMYQEIENVRDFGVESCWSGIGGFVGIFVGYSLMQVPSLFAEFCESVIRKLMSHLGMRPPRVTAKPDI